MKPLFLVLIFSLLAPFLSADDGYRLWLRYDRDAKVSAGKLPLSSIEVQVRDPKGSTTLDALKSELDTAFSGLWGQGPKVTVKASDGQADLGAEGYAVQVKSGKATIRAESHLGALYGAFDLLRCIQSGTTLDGYASRSAPKIERRLLNHWDNLDRTVERGYAGFSLWEWFYLPEIRSTRYRDYARACASIGINGTVITNVNANAQILTAPYLQKVEALAQEFRPYGVRVYLTARFSAPIEIGGLPTADPLDPAVQKWWKDKVDEIYQVIPDFGGFLVKANSEGQPGPQDYKRTHADGANTLADALKPHGGIVMWRAFVYSADNKEDRVRQAVTEFEPLDGKFRDNVVLQIKNGPLDFMPREPFSPLFGRMPKTQLALELQIAQEYLGQSIQLAYLAPMWEETLDADTFSDGPGSTIAKRISTSHGNAPTVIAGVANTGTDRNWTGHLLAQSNWYAYGRLAWDPELSSKAIADEWTALTFGRSKQVMDIVPRMLMGSRETVVNFSMPLGLHHIMAEGHHYGPGPWVDGLGRADWNSTYYHRADTQGIGFDRTATGSNAIEQYAPELQKLWGNPATCPEDLILWFHHLPWDHKMKSGRTLWDELSLRYQQGVDEVGGLRTDWDKLRGVIDPEQHREVAQRLFRQELDAREWRDACLLYFQTFSKRPFPEGVDPTKTYSLEHYMARKLRNMPGHH